MIAIELFDPLEIIREPLVLEPYQVGIDNLPSPPPILRVSKKKKKAFKKIMPTQDILILGTVPRNLVNLKLIEEKQERKSHDEEDTITISKMRKSMILKVNIKDGTVAKCKEECKRAFEVQKCKKRQSAVFPLPHDETGLNEKETKTYLALQSQTPTDNPSAINSMDVSIDPVLVVQSDVVL